MLHEIIDVKQEQGPGRRRWFESHGLDLIVWLDRHERVTGFQLCYNLGHGEHALTWRAEGGFAHYLVDTGSAAPLKNLTPVLVRDGCPPWVELAQLFEERSATLAPALRELIRSKLAERAADSAA